MNQSFFNGLHFITRALLTFGLFFTLINHALDDRFVPFWQILVILAALIAINAFIEIKFTPTTDFWLRLPVRLIIFILLWGLNTFLLIAFDRSTVSIALLIMLSYHLFTLLREWQTDRKTANLKHDDGSSTL